MYAASGQPGNPRVTAEVKLKLNLRSSVCRARARPGDVMDIFQVIDWLIADISHFPGGTDWLKYWPSRINNTMLLINDCFFEVFIFWNVWLIESGCRHQLIICINIMLADGSS